MVKREKQEKRNEMNKIKKKGRVKHQDSREGNIKRKKNKVITGEEKY